MAIVFDEIDGVIQPEATESPPSRSSENVEHHARDASFERNLREWLAAQRRRERLSAN